MTEFEQKLIKALIRVRDARNDPETVKSIVDKAIGAEEDVIPIEEPEANAPSAEELARGAFGEEEPIGTLPKDDKRPLWVGKDGQVHIGEPGEEYTKQYGELDPHIRKALDDFTSSSDHFGEEQAEGLSNLLEGLRDTPHDNRW